MNVTKLLRGDHGAQLTWRFPPPYDLPAAGLARQTFQAMPTIVVFQLTVMMYIQMELTGTVHIGAVACEALGQSSGKGIDATHMNVHE